MQPWYKTYPLWLVCLFSLSACSTVLEGRSQTIAIHTQPEGASCVIKDNDIILGVVQKTPGDVQVYRNKNDILVECTKEGYARTAQRNRADKAITSLGNMALLQLSPLGNMVDSLTGADHKYDAYVMIELERDIAHHDSQKTTVMANASAPALPTAVLPDDTLQAVPVTTVHTAALPNVASPPPPVVSTSVTAVATSPVAYVATAPATASPSLLLSPGTQLLPPAPPVLNVTQLASRAELQYAQLSEPPTSADAFQPPFEITQ